MEVAGDQRGYLSSHKSLSEQKQAGKQVKTTWGRENNYMGIKLCCFSFKMMEVTWVHGDRKCEKTLQAILITLCFMGK